MVVPGLFSIFSVHLLVIREVVFPGGAPQESPNSSDVVNSSLTMSSSSQLLLSSSRPIHRRPGLCLQPKNVPLKNRYLLVGPKHHLMPVPSINIIVIVFLAISNTLAAVPLLASVYDCVANVSISHKEHEHIQLRINYRDPHPVRFLQALRFSEQHNLRQGNGCDSSSCVAQSLLASIDGSLCTQLLRWQSVFVSIGEMCDVAMSLRYARARTAAFPFDWNVSPLGRIADMLESNFTNGFLRAETTHFGALGGELGAVDHRSDEVEFSISPAKLSVPAYDEGSGVFFPHDFPATESGGGGAMLLDAVRDKYSRRIQRLQALLAQDNLHVFLIEERADYDDWKTKRERPLWKQFEAAGSIFTDVGQYERDLQRIIRLFEGRHNIHVISAQEAHSIIEEARRSPTCLEKTGGGGFKFISRGGSGDGE